jgi:lipid II:glycine glycyltransferase (peptidoglycan interpeptide bridge formation enzyme)
MRFLKKKGCKLLDLEGIYDPRNPVTKRWRGFTLFKRGFGGREVEYIGSFVKYPKLWSKILFLPARFF